MKKSTTRIGVICAQFQVPSMHAGYIRLITDMAKCSDRLIVFVKYKICQPDINNPFSRRVREAMVAQSIEVLGLSAVTIITNIEDSPVSSRAWSNELDAKIQGYMNILPNEPEHTVSITVCDTETDSYARYCGEYASVDSCEGVTLSDADFRRDVMAMPESSLTVAHREGIMYGLKEIYPVGMAVVDAIIYRWVDGRLAFLLGRKPREDSYRIVGGFFDVKQDDSLEDSVTREGGEEVLGVTFGEMQYVMSKKIDDWRYRGNQHKIISSLFVVEFLSGVPEAGDDLEEVVWFFADELPATSIVLNHRLLVEKATEHLNKQVKYFV